MSIIDTNVDTTPHLGALKGAGVSTIIRYLSPINPSGEKCTKAAEAKAIAAAGLRLGLVCEGWGDFAHGGISAGAGERDGAWCTKYAPSVGAPAGAAIFYAVDVDASADQIRQLVLPYFRSIRAAHQAAAVAYRVGAYGSGNVLAAVLGEGLADLDWLSCSLGWGGSRAYLNKKPTLVQHAPGKLCGIGCDRDDAEGDFGDFVPGSVAEQGGIAGPAAAPVTRQAAAPQAAPTPLLTQLFAQFAAVIARNAAH